MRILFKIALVLFCISCNHMIDQSLYEPSNLGDNPISNFSFKNIFVDSQSSGVWGTKEHPCKQVMFSSKKNSIGKDHLYIKWNQTAECNYLGMGFPWGNYKSKNLAPILKDAAIELKIKVDSGSYTKIPVFFALVDYSGKQCMTKINYLGIEGGQIDTNWTKITLPLQTFNYTKKGVNMGNIKELKIEFQKKGAIHLDDIKVVQHKHNYRKYVESSTKTYTKHPFSIGVGKEHWWGINPEYSNNFSFISKDEFSSNFISKTKRHPETSLETSEALAVTINSHKKQIWNNFGFAIHNWKRVDVSSIYRTSAVQFKIKADSIPKLSSTIRCYSGKTRAIHKILSESNYSKIKEGHYNVCIPFKSFVNFKKLNWNTLKEIRFKILENSNFEIGDFKIIEFRGNPEKPNQWRGI